MFDNTLKKLFGNLFFFEMKTHDKMNSITGKILNCGELKSLKGGVSDHDCCVCLNGNGQVMGYMAASNQSDCSSACGACHWSGNYGPWSYCNV